jgi:hypothetical protein
MDQDGTGGGLFQMTLGAAAILDVQIDGDDDGTLWLLGNARRGMGDDEAAIATEIMILLTLIEATVRMRQDKNDDKNDEETTTCWLPRVETIYGGTTTTAGKSRAAFM